MWDKIVCWGSKSDSNMRVVIGGMVGLAVIAAILMIVAGIMVTEH